VVDASSGQPVDAPVDGLATVTNIEVQLYSASGYE